MYLSQNIFYNLQYWLYQKVANTKIARKFRVFEYTLNYYQLFVYYNSVISKFIEFLLFIKEFSLIGIINAAQKHLKC